MYIAKITANNIYIVNEHIYRMMYLLYFVTKTCVGYFRNCNKRRYVLNIGSTNKALDEPLSALVEIEFKYLTMDFNKKSSILSPYKTSASINVIIKSIIAKQN